MEVSSYKLRTVPTKNRSQLACLCKQSPKNQLKNTTKGKNKTNSEKLSVGDSLLNNIL